MHECSKELKKKVGNSQEPYRIYLRPIRNKLKSTQKEIELFLNGKKPLKQSLLVQSVNEIINPLKVVYNSLCEIKCKSIADGSVLDLLRRAHSFGLNLARLDIRQESKRHLKLMKSICKHQGLGDFEKCLQLDLRYRGYVRPGHPFNVGHKNVQAVSGAKPRCLIRTSTSIKFKCNMDWAPNISLDLFLNLNSNL